MKNGKTPDKVEEPKTCPIMSYRYVEEGRYGKIACEKDGCAVWDINRAQCGFKSYVRIFGNMGR